jgi:GNAT superfamily N-acetyltransferase
MSVEESMRARLDAARALAVPVKELAAGDRHKLRTHLLSLGAQDRYLRFGNPLGDPIICSYVDGIDFSRDTVFGVFDRQLGLQAAGHFARDPVVPGAGESRSAEFGLSVADNARGQGLGTALFVRAATRARNLGIDRILMHCLTQNQAMMRIARKAGMKISSSSGEADAYLELEPADAASVLREAAQDQIGLFDFAFKEQMRNARILLGGETG